MELTCGCGNKFEYTVNDIKNAHRLLYGNSQNPRDIGKLMDVEVARLIFTSPPYNLGGKMYQSYKDNLESKEYIKFILDVVNNVKKYLKGFLFLNISYGKNQRGEFIEILYKITKESGLKFLELVVWNKKHGMPISSKEMLTRQFEQILLAGTEDAVKEDLELFFCGRNDKKAYFNKKTNKGITNYWEIGTNKTQLKNHLACFPIALPVKGIELMTQRGDIVLDPFLGSGTTLVAAAKTGRICYGIEIDPVYFQISLERMKRLGYEAVKVCNINDTQSNHIESQQEVTG